MQAAHKFGDVTRAADGGSDMFRQPQEETYAPANSIRVPSSRLVFPGPRMQVQTRIVVDDRHYVLKDMFVIDLEYLEDDGQVQVFASHRTLPVHGYGADQGAALQAFCRAFDFQWRHLVQVPEESLTEGGKRRRHAMLAAVEKYP